MSVDATPSREGVPTVTQVLMDVSAAPEAGPLTPAQVWHYRWDITFTWRSKECSPTGKALTSHLCVSDPDELANIILHTSYDPRLHSYYYERKQALDMSAAPRACASCGEAYDPASQRVWLRSCDCGGHMVYQCVMCGREQMYPEVTMTCQ